jgi:hypothetical protein
MNERFDNARRRFLCISAVGVSGVALNGCGGGGPGGDPALPDRLSKVAASLSAGQWGTVIVSNQLNIDPVNSGDGMFSYSPHIEWDNEHGRMMFLGGVHGDPANVQRFFLGRYLESTNEWNPMLPSTMPVQSGTGGGHTYYGWTLDQETGDVYGTAAFYDTANVRRYRYATDTWDNPLPSNTVWGEHCAAVALVYHPGLYGNVGGLLVGSNAGIWSLNLRDASPTWTVILDRTRPLTAMGDFPVGVYDPKTRAAYLGGGNATTSLWRIQASEGAGTPSPVAYPSQDIDPSGNGCVITASGNPANSLVLLDRTGAVSEFNGTSWSPVSATVPRALLDTTDDWWSAGAVAAHGCIVFPKGTRTPSSATSTTMHLWKR